MHPDFILFCGQFVAAVLYAIGLEFGLRRRYEPGYTWITVVWGTGQVGLLVAARLAWAPLPALAGEALAWWVWWIWTYSFLASGLPIIVWQLILQGRRWRAVARAWERWTAGGGQ